MRFGYPPLIVPTERKRDYLNALRLAGGCHRGI